MDGVESENCSLSSSLPTKIANGTDDFNASIGSTPNLQSQSTVSQTKREEYSSCEDETDESYSDTESEMRDESIEKDTSVAQAINTNTIKRFSGDCESVSDVLTQHDRTKNRKTYHLKGVSNISNNKSPMIEKLEMSLASVTEGINIRLEESTTAEDYFSEPIIESFINELIEQAAEECDIVPEDCESTENGDCDMDNASLQSDQNTRNDSRRASQKREPVSNSHFKKRLSNTSKASSDSSASNVVVNHEPYDSDRDSGRDSQKSDREAGTAESEGERKSEPRLANVEKLDWNKTQESLQNSKKNVEILRQNAALEGNTKYFKRKISLDNKRHSERIHPFHTHMLLYYGVYDTEQVLYAFQTLRNIIACDCRTFLCLSTTTSITNSPIKQLLVRHRKSVFGKGFAGTIINTEFSHAYRGCMYLESLVTLCLYYARSYFQKECVEINKLPSSEDVHGNCKIQLASIELLTTLCTEMIGIVRDMGKGLACYIGELMGKCKLQKVIASHEYIKSLKTKFFSFSFSLIFTDNPSLSHFICAFVQHEIRFVLHRTNRRIQRAERRKTTRRSGSIATVAPAHERNQTGIRGVESER